MNKRKIIYPQYITICLTSRCNAKCMHCSSGTSKIIKELPSELVEKVLIELNRLGVFQIGFSGGEPLLHPQIWEILRKAVEIGFNVGIGTNGYIINHHMVKRLKKIGIHHVQISLDSINPKSHDEFRGIKGLWTRAVNAVELLQQENILVNICMTPNRKNWMEVEAMIDWCVEKNVNCFNMSQFVPTGNGTAELDLLPFEWKQVLEVWERKRKEYESKMAFTAHEAQLVLVSDYVRQLKGFKGCQAGKGVGCINYDGRVTPCVMLDVDCGNIYQKSFEDIWGNSKIISELQDEKTFFNQCSECRYFPKCKGCRGVAYAITGDYKEKDPHCWKNEYEEKEKLYDK